MTDAITVGQLRALVADLPDDAPVYTQADGCGYGGCAGYDIMHAAGLPPAVLLHDASTGAPDVSPPAPVRVPISLVDLLDQTAAVVDMVDGARLTDGSTFHVGELAETLREAAKDVATDG